MTAPLGRRRGRWRVLGLAVLCVVVLVGCQTTALVRVDVQPDGSGTITVDVYLDAEAAEQVGDLSEMLAVEDLEAAGWELTGPASPEAVAEALGRSRDAQAQTRRVGGVEVYLERSFTDVDEANAILAGLSGPSGPFGDVALTRDSSLYKTRLGFTGTIDLSEGLDTFGDADLTKVLGGTLSDTVVASGDATPSGDDLRVGLQLAPSKDLEWSGQMGNDSMGNQTVSASASLGAGPEAIDVHASKTRWVPVVGTVVMVGLALLGLIAFGFSYRRRANRAQERLFRHDGGVTDTA